MTLAITGQSLEEFWSDIKLGDEDIDFIINVLLEREQPLTSEEMLPDLIAHRLMHYQKEQERLAEPEAALYLPEETYDAGQELAFPALNLALGTVKGKRPGTNPELGAFDVIQVEMKDTGDLREFAANLKEHILNQPPEVDTTEEDLEDVDTVIARFGKKIAAALESKLAQAQGIVFLAGRWFPRALLVEMNEGYLNLAEAVLDVSSGGPLHTSAFLEHLDFPPSVDPLLAEFSLDYGLQEDPRFDEVGPAGVTAWYLKRLEPPDVLFKPQRLEYEGASVDRSLLTEDLIALEAKLDDELSPVEPAEDVPDEVTVSLIFPHWRVGTLPLSARLAPLFPTAYEAPRIRFMLVDGHSGEKFPGWVVRHEGYIAGLDEWYRKYEIPAGGLVTLRHGDEPGEVVVEAVDKRSHNDWIRTATIDAEGNIGFTMLKQSVGSGYDDLMVVGLMDPVALDEAWLTGKQQRMNNERLLASIFRELAKLTPQSAVHAESFYSGINVLRRMPPELVFAELMTRPYYVHVGDLYWRFDMEIWNKQ